MENPGGKAFTDDMKEAFTSLAELYAPIQGHLDEMEARLSAEMESHHSFLKKYTDHLANYRGKRLRPALVFFAAKAIGEVGPAHVEVAAAAELMHCATLVHDDILDEAETRRRVETVNRKWGNERAVLLGDYVFTKAFEMVQRTGRDDLVSDLIASAQEICLGEMLQIEKRFDLGLDEPFYLSMIGMKTASLFRFCAGAGARLAGGTAAQVESLRAFAGDVGVAFQIIDDCLDLVGDEALVGKSLGTDLDNGKLTLPLIHAYALRSPEARKEIERVFREGPRSEALRNFLLEYDSVEYAVSRAVEYVEEGCRALDALPASPALCQALRLGRFVLNRKW